MRPDIFLDIMMSAMMDGLDVCRITKNDPELKKTYD